MHKRKRLTMVVAREDLDATLVARIEELEHENRVLRRKVTKLTMALGYAEQAEDELATARAWEPTLKDGLHA